MCVFFYDIIYSRLLFCGGEVVVGCDDEEVVLGRGWRGDDGDIAGCGSTSGDEYDGMVMMYDGMIMMMMVMIVLRSPFGTRVVDPEATGYPLARRT